MEKLGKRDAMAKAREDALEDEVPLKRRLVNTRTQAPVPNTGRVEEEEAEKVSGRDKSITFTLTDNDLLDCPICFGPLISHIVQCENGHVACSSCCEKVANKCPSCTRSIGNIRCLALEKVLESLKSTCRFSDYGCKETITYNDISDHERTCLHKPFSCPMTHCSFIGSSNQLSRHFSLEHPGHGTKFRFNNFKSISLRLDAKFHVLMEETKDVLFLLTNNTIPFGNKMSISYVGPLCGGKNYSYDLWAHSQGSSLYLRTSTESINGELLDHQPSTCLLVPEWIFSDTMKLMIKIHNRGIRSQNML